MSNNFETLEADKALPENVKRETLGNLDTIKLVLDLVDMFMIKASTAFTESVNATGGISSASLKHKAGG